jgi:hypothetical protein
LQEESEKTKRSFYSWLSHAFAVKDPASAVNDEDREILGRVAVWVVRRRMSAPAVLFLESVRPLGYLGSQALVFFQPIITNVLNEKDYRQFTAAIEKREAVNVLIDRITEAENDYSQAPPFMAGNKAGNKTDINLQEEA